MFWNSIKTLYSKIAFFLAIGSLIWSITLSQPTLMYWSMYSHRDQYKREIFIVNSSYCHYSASRGKSMGSFTISAHGLIENKEMVMDLEPYFDGEKNCANVNNRLTSEFKVGTALDVLYISTIEAGWAGRPPSIVPFREDFKKHTLDLLKTYILLAYLPLLVFGLPYFFKMAGLVITVLKAMITGKIR